MPCESSTSGPATVEVQERGRTRLRGGVLLLLASLLLYPGAFVACGTGGVAELPTGDGSSSESGTTDGGGTTNETALEGLEGDRETAQEGATSPGEGIPGSDEGAQAPEGKVPPDKNSGSYQPSAIGEQNKREPGYHPLSSKRTRLVRVEEVAIVAHTDSNSGSVLDDYKSSYNTLQTFKDPLGTDKRAGRVVQVEMGDVDGDNKAETVVVSLYEGYTSNLQSYDFIRVTVLDEGKVTASLTIGVKDKEGYCDVDLALGDVDGDGKAEVLIAGSLGYRGQRSGLPTRSSKSSRLWIYRGDLKTKLKEINLPYGFLRVAAGDTDGDSLAELVVAGRTEKQSYSYIGAKAFDDATKKFAVIGTWTDQWAGFNRAEVAIGDLDGDGAGEIVFGVSSVDNAAAFTSGKFLVSVVDDNRTTGKFKTLKSYPEKSLMNAMIHWDGVRVITGDFNGDGRQEIVLALAAAAFASYGSPTIRGYHCYVYHYCLDRRAERFYDTIPENLVQTFASRSSLSATGIRLAAGDVDRDGRDELVISTAGAILSDTTYQQRVVEASFKSKYYQFKLARTWSRSLRTRAHGTHRFFMQAPVAMGDVDGDNITVEYTGKNWLTLPDPMVMVVMATPPVQKGLSQDYNGSRTEFGSATYHGESKSTEVGVSATVTISCKIGDPFDFVSAEASLAITQELAKTKTSKSLETYGVLYTAVYPDNSVIFQGTLYRQYEYKLLTHPDPKKVGTLLTIDVPVGFDMYHWSLDFFNKTFAGRKGVEIGGEVFNPSTGKQHTPGSVVSYPRLEDRKTILGKYKGWISKTATGNTVTVAQAKGRTALYIDLSKEKVDAESKTIGVTATAGFKVGKVGVSAAVGGRTKSIYAVTVGSKTRYQGVVGSITKPDEYNRYFYSFGLMVFNFKPQARPGFQVINYWVENLGPGHKK